MEAIRNYTIAIGAKQKAEKQANSIIDAMYEGHVSCLVVLWPLAMPHVRYICATAFCNASCNACAFGPTYRG